MPVRVKINRSLLNAAVSEGRNGIAMSKVIADQWEDKVQEAQKELIQNFQSNPVTQEIDAGVESSNISGTLAGRGNLFTFIGFEQGDNPTEIIKDLLKDKINIQAKPIGRGKFKISISLPDKESIFKATPIPWNPGRSWVDGIEKGISGLGSYVYKESSASRSGKGIQTKSSRGGRFSNRSYITTMFKEFEKSLRK